MSRTLEELDKYLVGHWDFENNFNDISGNGNHGTPANVEWKPTARGIKPKSSNGASIKTGEILPLVSGSDFSVSVWFHADVDLSNSSNDYPVLIQRQDWASNKGWSLEYNKPLGRLVANAKNASGWIPLESIRTSFPVGWYHVVAVYHTDGDRELYINGQLDKSATAGYPDFTETADNLGMFINADMTGDDTCIYSTALDATEVLALYNSTKQGHGVLSHERSFTHRLSPQVDASTVFATDMRTKQSDGKLIDLSGNGNDGTIAGAVRSSGYFVDSMRFDNDYIIVQHDASLNIASLLAIKALIKTSGSTGKILSKGNVAPQYSMDVIPNGIIRLFGYDDGAAIGITDGTTVRIDDDKYHYIVGTFDGTTWKIYIDGVLNKSNIDAGILSSNSEFFGIAIRGTTNDYIGDFVSVVVQNSIPSNIAAEFNSLAVLPLYTIDFSRYPSNTTVYDSNIPYSSMRVESGSFKIDGGQLVCVTDGTISMRNAHAFDGAEYVKLVKDGVEYGRTSHSPILDSYYDELTSVDNWVTASSATYLSASDDGITWGKSNLNNYPHIVNILDIPLDVSTKHLYVEIYIKDSGVLDRLLASYGCGILLEDLTGGSKLREFRISVDELKVGNNTIFRALTDYDADGGGDMSSIDAIRLQYVTDAAETTMANGDIVFKNLSFPSTYAEIGQGSSLITVQMQAGDVLDSLNVQFREEVE